MWFSLRFLCLLLIGRRLTHTVIDNLFFYFIRPSFFLSIANGIIFIYSNVGMRMLELRFHRFHRIAFLSEFLDAMSVDSVSFISSKSSWLCFKRKFEEFFGISTRKIPNGLNHRKWNMLCDIYARMLTVAILHVLILPKKNYNFYWKWKSVLDTTWHGTVSSSLNDQTVNVKSTTLCHWFTLVC